MRAPLKTRLFLPAIALLLFVAFPGSSTGQYRFLENGNPLHRGSDSGFLLDTPTRLKIDLSGEWSYSVEDGPSGIVEVPSAYDGVGKVAFERTFEVTQGQLDTNQFKLVMFGVNQGCEVYLNGEFLLNHSGGYTSFLQQVPSRLLQPGKDNHIRVVVTNELDPKRTLLMHPQILGWRDYGGILRDIFLLATPKLYIKDAVTTTGLSENFSQARISVRAEIAGKALPSPSDKKPTVLGLYVEEIRLRAVNHLAQRD